MKLCVFPNDPIMAYFKKGEIKDRYFNPKNLFDIVHIISLFDDEIESKKVKELAGNGELIIHKLGKANLSNYKTFEKKVIELLNEIKPDIIRAYNPLIQGWLALKASQKLKIPLVVSLHTNYEQQKEELKKHRKYVQYLKLAFTSRKIEKVVISNADTVICVYEFIVPYAQKMGGKNIQVIYNKVDLQKFSPDVPPKFKNKVPTIISVGRLIDQKNHMYVLQAIKDMDVKLLIIGDGPNLQKLTNFIKNEKITDKVEIINSVTNEDLAGYYTSAEIYVQPMENLGGIPIPVLEAMACGLCIVMSRHSNDYSEIIDDSVYFVDNNPNNFKMAFEKILLDDDLRNKLKIKSLETIKKISGKKMEAAELEVYKKLRIDKED